MRFKSYKRVIDFLFSQLPMYQRVGASAFKKDLTNIEKLIEAIGNPHLNFRSIHIAGTNGKGSTTHLIASALVQQGFKVGLYTSPHYLDFRERIKVGNALVSKRFVIDFVNTHIEIIQKIHPSFFEITVAMAFDYFSKEEVDIAIIETGLGGRLDSTNILSPLLSVITNISFDHQNMLGNTLQMIAKEKAGIIKKNIPVLIGERQAAVEKVFVEKAKKTKSPLYYADELCSLQKKDIGNPFLAKNKMTAKAALKILGEIENGFKLKANIIEKGFDATVKNVHSIGRWQVISTKPHIVVDSAHNLEGLSIAIDTIKRMPANSVHFVIGFVNDKSLNGLLQLFPIDAHYYFAKADIPRGLDAKELQHKANEIGLRGKSYISVRKALSAAKMKYKNGDLIVVIGSIFVVAEVL